MTNNLPALPEAAQTRAIAIEQWNTITQVLYPDAPPHMQVLAWDYCKSRDLDPMLKPVHVVKFWNKDKQQFDHQIIPGIGLYRTMANNTGEYMGKDAPVYGDNIEKFNISFPESCSITVYRFIHGQRCPFTATVFWLEEYAKLKDGGPNSFWRTRPKGQIAKVAEAAALRMAFPNEVGSQPTYEERHTHEVDVTPPKAKSIEALDMEEVHTTYDDETGEVIEEVSAEEVYASKTVKEWETWAQAIAKKINSAGSVTEVTGIFASPKIASGTSWLRYQDNEELRNIAIDLEDVATKKMDSLS